MVCVDEFFSSITTGLRHVLKPIEEDTRRRKSKCRKRAYVTPSSRVFVRSLPKLRFLSIVEGFLRPSLSLVCHLLCPPSRCSSYEVSNTSHSSKLHEVSLKVSHWPDRAPFNLLYQPTVFSHLTLLLPSVQFLLRPLLVTPWVWFEVNDLSLNLLHQKYQDQRKSRRKISSRWGRKRKWS